MHAEAAARAVRLMVLDVDGVLTDGGLYYDESGCVMKRFNVQDGLGIVLLKRVGIEVAIITGRNSGVVSHRAADLGVAHVYQGVGNKREVAGKLLAKLGLDWSELAFMGDDLIDLPAMALCGLAIAPANARPIVKERVHAITEASGGHGAVREAIEFILNAQGKLEAAFAPYLAAQ